MPVKNEPWHRENSHHSWIWQSQFTSCTWSEAGLVAGGEPGPARLSSALCPGHSSASREVKPTMFPCGGGSGLVTKLCLWLLRFHEQRSLAGYSPWDSPSKNTGVGYHFLLQGIFPTQESNPGLLHCRQILYQLSCEGRPHVARGKWLSSERKTLVESGDVGHLVGWGQY